MKVPLTLLASVVGLGTFAVTEGGDVSKKPSERFKITTKKADDTVEVQADKDKIAFVVKSPSGISQAVIERLDEKWPGTVVLRLHLKGLERFRAQTGKHTLEMAVSLQDGKPKIRLWKDGNENPVLDDKSPLWLEVRLLDSDGKAARELPLKNGHFEIALPKALFEGNPRSITLDWIDFYRN